MGRRWEEKRVMRRRQGEGVGEKKMKKRDGENGVARQGREKGVRASWEESDVEERLGKEDQGEGGGENRMGRRDEKKWMGRKGDENGEKRVGREKGWARGRLGQ